MDANSTMMPSRSNSSRWISGGAVRQITRRDTAAHAHAEGQWLGARSGLFAVETVGERWLIGPGHALWIPPGLEHAARSHGAFGGWSLYASEIRSTTLPARPFTAAITPLAMALANRVIDDTGSERWDERSSRIAEVCWDEFAQLYRSALALPLPADPRLRRVTNLLDERLGDRRPIEAWASLAAMSPRTFIRRFPAETGLSFSAWRQRARLLVAQERLARGEPVTVVAAAVGYGSLGAFSTAFRQLAGCSPRAYAADLSARFREIRLGIASAP